MDIKNHFDFNRFWLLLKLEFFKNRFGLFMALEISFGMLFFIGFLLAITTDQSIMVYEHEENFGFTLITGGFILSSLSFSGLTSSLKRYSYLTLPASTFEKFLCMWLLTSIGWIVLFTLTFYLYALIANYIGTMLFQPMTFVSFDPLGELPLTIMSYYFVLQAIFMVGAVHFKGYALAKTLFVLVLLTLVSGVIFYCMLSDFMTVEMEACMSDVDFLKEQPIYQFWQMVKGLFWWVLAPLCWLITYLGLKEQEA